MDVIDKFYTYERGNMVHSFLSNFYVSPSLHVERLSTMLARTGEHAYQACKALTISEQEYILRAPTPGQSKARGREISLRPDWEAIKFDVMYEVLSAKFNAASGPLLARMLLDTGDALLIEGNTWGDTTWGKCDGVGRNWLGLLLMARRSELRAEIG